MAIENGHFPVVEFLVNNYNRGRMPKSEAIQSCGNHAIELAAASGNLDCLKFLFNQVAAENDRISAQIAAGGDGIDNLPTPQQMRANYLAMVRDAAKALFDGDKITSIRPSNMFRGKDTPDNYKIAKYLFEEVAQTLSEEEKVQCGLVIVGPREISSRFNFALDAGSADLAKYVYNNFANDDVKANLDSDMRSQAGSILRWGEIFVRDEPRYYPNSIKAFNFVMEHVVDQDQRKRLINQISQTPMSNGGRLSKVMANQRGEFELFCSTVFDDAELVNYEDELAPLRRYKDSLNNFRALRSDLIANFSKVKARNLESDSNLAEVDPVLAANEVIATILDNPRQFLDMSRLQELNVRARKFSALVSDNSLAPVFAEHLGFNEEYFSEFMPEQFRSCAVGVVSKWVMSPSHPLACLDHSAKPIKSPIAVNGSRAQVGVSTTNSPLESRQQMGYCADDEVERSSSSENSIEENDVQFVLRDSSSSYEEKSSGIEEDEKARSEMSERLEVLDVEEKQSDVAMDEPVSPSRQIRTSLTSKITQLFGRSAKVHPEPSQQTRR